MYIAGDTSSPISNNARLVQNFQWLYVILCNKQLSLEYLDMLPTSGGERRKKLNYHKYDL